MKLFNEYKDLFTADELANVWGSTVCQANWRYGQTSRPDLELQFPMWFQEYWNCWKQEWFPVAPVEFINCIHERFIDVVKKETEYDDWILTRSMIAGNTFGLDGDVHQDWMKPNESRTGVLYLNGDWQDNWGGETVIYNEENKSQMEISKIEHGKLVTFDGYNSHIGKGPQRRCPRLRCIFAIQVTKRDAFKKWAGEQLKVDL